MPIHEIHHAALFVASACAILGCSSSSASPTADPPPAREDAGTDAEPVSDGGDPGAGKSWLASWATAPSMAVGAHSLENQTIRQVVRTSLGGEQIRVRFTNVFGSVPLSVTGARVAHSVGGAAIDPATDKELKFSGSASATIPPGEELVSDAVDLSVEPNTEVAISMYFAAPTQTTTTHVYALRPNYVVAGDALSRETLTDFETFESQTPLGVFASSYFLAALDVYRPKANVVVVFSDSNADAPGSSDDADHQYPNYLARRALTEDGALGFVSAAMGGNRLTHNFVGPKGLDRFERDVLGQSGVTHVYFYLGANDIGFESQFPEQAVTPEQFSEALDVIIAKAKARGLRVIGGTFKPVEYSLFQGEDTWSPELTAKQNAFNEVLIGKTTLDGLIRHDLILADPDQPSRVKPTYLQEDGVHLTREGLQVLANGVDLTLFK
jgi:lysophospholipase L1-like esterase